MWKSCKKIKTYFCQRTKCSFIIIKISIQILDAEQVFGRQNNGAIHPDPNRKFKAKRSSAAKSVSARFTRSEIVHLNHFLPQTNRQSNQINFPLPFFRWYAEGCLRWAVNWCVYLARLWRGRIKRTCRSPTLPNYSASLQNPFTTFHIKQVCSDWSGNNVIRSEHCHLQVSLLIIMNIFYDLFFKKWKWEYQLFY